MLAHGKFLAAVSLYVKTLERIDRITMPFGDDARAKYYENKRQAKEDAKEMLRYGLGDDIARLIDWSDET